MGCYHHPLAYGLSLDFDITLVQLGVSLRPTWTVSDGFLTRIRAQCSEKSGGIGLLRVFYVGGWAHWFSGTTWATYTPEMEPCFQGPMLSQWNQQLYLYKPGSAHNLGTNDKRLSTDFSLNGRYPHITDDDAFVSMNAHAALMYFLADGWSSPSHPGFLRRIIMRGEEIVVVKPN